MSSFAIASPASQAFVGPASAPPASPEPASPGDGVVHGIPRTLLRAEGLVVLIVATIAYSRIEGGWLLYAVLFFLPDLSMLGYLAGPRRGAALYNLGHSYTAPALLGAIGIGSGVPELIAAALIWVAHIGFDRAVGYGFKYATGFAHTHLGSPFARPAAAHATVG